MSFKQMGFLAAALILTACGTIIFFRDYVVATRGVQEDITDLSSLYEAEEEIAAAKAALQKGVEPVEVVTRDKKPHIGIVIDGLPDRTTTARFLDVLKKHNVSAVFFVEGQNAANQPETIQLIREAGQEIGNYTFVGVAAAQTLPQDRLFSEVCRTQRIIEVLTAKKPRFFRAPNTVYSEDLLCALRAAGIDYVVKENAHYAPGFLQNEAGAVAYAKQVPQGSIIAIDIVVPVEPVATDMHIENLQPAIDKQPTLTDRPFHVKDRQPTVTDKPAEVDLSTQANPSAEVNQPVKHQTEPVDAADELDWLLTALKGMGKDPGSIFDFRKIRYVPAAPLESAAETEPTAEEVPMN